MVYVLFALVYVLGLRWITAPADGTPRRLSADALAGLRIRAEIGAAERSASYVTEGGALVAGVPS